MSAATTTLPGPAVRLDPGIPADELEVAALHALWRRMTIIREHEILVEDLNARGVVRGSTHLYVGMEACAVGIVASLAREDLLIGYYRSHGHALAMGVPVRAVMSEVLGRVSGCSGGRGGTKHLMDVSRNYLGAYAIVGQQAPLGAGLALALKRAAAAGERPPSIAACLFGDGAANAGATLEALNLASVLAVPCLFVCENNEYAVSTPARDMVGGGSIAARGAGLGVPGTVVDGMDVLAVREAVAQARAALVAEPDAGPRLLELATYRYRGHSVFQVEDDYRDAGELERFRERDPIATMRRRLLGAGVAEDELEAERRAIVAQLREDADWSVAQPPFAEVRSEDVLATERRGLADWGAAA